MQKKLCYWIILIIIIVCTISAIKLSSVSTNQVATYKTEVNREVILKNNRQFFQSEMQPLLKRKQANFKVQFHYSNININNYYHGNKLWGAITVFTIDGKQVFCIDPFIPLNPEVITTTFNNNNFSKLKPEVQQKIKIISEYAYQRYNKTKNMDYLFGAQILIYQQIEPTEFKTTANTVIQSEINELKTLVSNHYRLPSFVDSQKVKVHTLQYNADKKVYELLLTDINRQLVKFDFANQYGDYNVKKIGDNQLYISTSNHLASQSSIITTNYDPYPKKNHYYYAGGQNVIKTNSPAVQMKIKFQIEPAPGSGEFRKTDANNNPLPGVEYGLYYDKEAKKQLMVRKSNQTGKIIFPNIKPGNYYLKELKNLEGYLANPQIYSVTIKPGRTQKWNDQVNHKIIGYVELTKNLITGSAINDQTMTTKLKDVEFGIFTEKDELIEIIKTNQEGYAKSSAIEYGENYYLQELKVPDKIKINSQKYYFNIKNNQKVVKINNGKALENKLITGKAKLEKHGINYQGKAIKLNDIEFTLYQDQDGDQVYETMIKKYYTDENGMLITDLLTYGDYQIIETKANDDYHPTYKEEFKIRKNNEVIDLNSQIPIINRKIWQRIKIEKKGKVQEELQPLAGVEFAIYEDKNNNMSIDPNELTPITKLITNKTGEAISKLIPKSKNQLLIQEINTVEGYQVDDTVHVIKPDESKVLIDENGNYYHLSEFELINPMIYGQARLQKVGKSKTELKALANVEFAVYRDVDNNKSLNEVDRLIDTIVTNKQGEATTKKLPYGNYLLRETTTNVNYLLNNEVWPFKIQENEKIIKINQGKPIVNHKIENKIIINKYDYDTKQPIVDTKFTVYQLNSEQLVKENIEIVSKNQFNEAELSIVDELITDKTGQVISKYLAKGQYYIIEIKANENYKINDDQGYLVTINNVTDQIKINIANKKLIKTVKVNTNEKLAKPIEVNTNELIPVKLIKTAIDNLDGKIIIILMVVVCLLLIQKRL